MHWSTHRTPQGQGPSRWRHECSFFYLPLPAPFRATVTGTYYHYRFLTSDFCVSDFLTAPFFNKPLCIGPLFSNPTLHCFFSSLLLRCGRNDCAYLGSNREPWWLAAFNTLFKHARERWGNRHTCILSKARRYATWPCGFLHF